VTGPVTRPVPVGTPGRRPRSRWPAVALGIGAVAALTGGLLGAFAPSLAVFYGLPPAGVLVSAGLPAARVLAFAAAAAGVGQLLVAAVLVPGRPGDVVSPAGYAGLRAARWCALVQALASAVVAVLTVVENGALPAGHLTHSGPALLLGLQQIEPATGWLLGGLMALVVAGLAGWVLSWRGAVGLLLLALGALLPITLTSATNAERSHDIAGDALTLHVLGAVLWLGSALATACHLARRGQRPAVVLRRHAAISTWSLVLVGASGVISSAYAVAVPDLVSSGFGRLVLLSGASLAALALVGNRVRAFAARAARTAGTAVGPGRRPGPASAVGLVTLELSLLGAAAALGTGLARLVPPAELGYETSRSIYLIGFDLPAEFHPADLLLRCRPDLVFGPLAVLGAALYLAGLRRLRRRSVGPVGPGGSGGTAEPWPLRYSAAWFAGCAVLLVATCSGLGSYAPALFSAHMVQHMLLATLAPALLVLGHGSTLARRAAGPGTERRLASLLGSPAAALASHPLLAWAAVAATLFGLYPTGLYAAVLQEHWAHLAMNTAFFGTGLALFWSILGHGLGRRALPPIGQLVMIFAVMALHAGFAAWLLGQSVPVAAGFYGSLRLPFVPDLLADQRLGAILGWVLGELPVILAVLALVLRWSRDDRPVSPAGTPVAASPGTPPSPPSGPPWRTWRGTVAVQSAPPPPVTSRTPGSPPPSP
jgi:cytochrome c oxidase assembly factor CtaG